jgi:dTDP-4-amino-4,6-dideoxygalactose transaminase
MPRTSLLPFALPDIGEAEIAEVREVLESGWITTGPKTRRFEEEFARYVGARFAVAVNSCTAAMHLALESQRAISS